MKKRFVWYVTIIGTLWLTGCSALEVITYPESQQMSGGTLRTQRVRLLEHRILEFQNEIEFSKDDLQVIVTAKSCRYFPITVGPPYIPVVPMFWSDWIFGPFGEKLVLAVSFDRAEGYEFDPSQFVIVQQGKEIKPIKSATSAGRDKCYTFEEALNPHQQVISNSGKLFILEYETRSWDFVLKLREIRNQSGTVVMPDIHFARRSAWVFSLLP